jgi:hypothetical protein
MLPKEAVSAPASEKLAPSSVRSLRLSSCTCGQNSTRMPATPIPAPRYVCHSTRVPSSQREFRMLSHTSDEKAMQFSAELM